MPYKSAKENFSKDEVLEILRRNVALYKDEREFVEYIVELATYLIDRHYGGERISSGEMPLPPGMRGPAKRPETHDTGGSLASKDLPPRVSDLRGHGRRTESGSFLPPSFAQDDSAPEAAKESADLDMPDSPPSGKDAPRTPPSPASQEPQGGSLHFVRGEHDPADANPPGHEPAPPGSEGQKPRTTVNVSRLGRARVYKVVRPYKVSTTAQVPCPVCGVQVPMGEPQCPNCGHLL